jgi:hypothetical protein
MSFHGSKTITAAGTAVPLVASTVTTPTLRFCAAVTIQYVGTHNIYGGFASAASGVSSSSKGFTLNSTDRSITLGDTANHQNNIDLATVYLDTDTNGESVTFTAEQF